MPPKISKSEKYHTGLLMTVYLLPTKKNNSQLDYTWDRAAICAAFIGTIPPPQFANLATCLT